MQELVPVEVTLILRNHLRSKSVSNQSLAEFLNELNSPNGKWDSKRASKYLGGERRFSYEIFFAIGVRFGIDPVQIILEAMSERQLDFQTSDIYEKSMKLRNAQ